MRFGIISLFFIDFVASDARLKFRTTKLGLVQFQWSNSFILKIFSANHVHFDGKNIISRPHFIVKRYLFGASRYCSGDLSKN
jgi:hypothetical protein